MSGYTYGINGDSDEDRLAKYSRVIGSNVQKIKQNGELFVYKLTNIFLFNM